MQLVIFAVLALVTLGAAAMVVLARNLLHSALWLVLALFGIAGIFFLLEAEFLGIVQILVYVGAIATLIIFAIMLSRRYFDPQQAPFNQQYGLVAGFSALLFVGLAAVITRAPWPAAAGQVPGDAIVQLGTDFVGPYVIPFEIASVLLVIAMIGAIMLAREKE